MKAIDTAITGHPVVSREEWVEARKALLAKEKAHTRERDELSRQRRDLPWVRVDKTGSRLRWRGFGITTGTGRTTALTRPRPTRLLKVRLLVRKRRLVTRERTPLP